MADDDIAFVHILHVTHRHGENFYACRTEEGARVLLAEYVSDNWEDEGLRKELGPIPDDPAEAIKMYFEKMGPTESHVIEITAVYP